MLGVSKYSFVTWYLNKTMERLSTKQTSPMELMTTVTLTKKEKQKVLCPWCNCVSVLCLVLLN